MTEASSPISLEYIAGFFDGEGSICLAKKRDPETGRVRSYVLTIQITQVQPFILYYLKDRYGGGITSRKEKDHPSWRVRYKWHVHHRQAVEFLKDIYPYLIIKAPQAELAFVFVQLCDDNPIHRHLPLLKRRFGLRRRALCYEQMRVLNKRGVVEENG